VQKLYLDKLQVPYRDILLLVYTIFILSGAYFRIVCLCAKVESILKFNFER
jgi:hypothetical protein